MTSHILSNLPEEYQTIVEFLDEKLYDESDFITIQSIRDKILVRYDLMKKQSTTKMSREGENYLYVKSQYKGTCATFKKYGHKSKDCSHIEGTNSPKCNYCDKSGHVNKEFWK